MNMHTLKLLVFQASFYLNISLTHLGYGVSSIYLFIYSLNLFSNGTSSLGKICPLLSSKAQETEGHFLCTALFNSPHRCSVYSCLGSDWAISKL